MNASVGDTGFLMPTEQYDADPAKDGNPLYLLAMRPEMPLRRPEVQDTFARTAFEELYAHLTHAGRERRLLYH